MTGAQFFSVCSLTAELIYGQGCIKSPRMVETKSTMDWIFLAQSEKSGTESITDTDIDSRGDVDRGPSAKDAPSTKSSFTPVMHK